MRILPLIARIERGSGKKGGCEQSPPTETGVAGPLKRAPRLTISVGLAGLDFGRERQRPGGSPARRSSAVAAFARADRRAESRRRSIFASAGLAAALDRC